ncbi:MAG: hypothetical protein K0R27_1870 [Xanthobacteraceae bacterium]|nr:hypothetical protein [Xanthobacteraceae bacterium]
MCDSVTARQRCRRAGKPALLVALAILLAGCAAADAPLPFITTPDPETTATTPPANETPAAGTGFPVQGNAAAHSGASNAGAASTGATAPATANSSPAAPQATAPHSPVRQDLPFPSFSTPATAGDRKVMTDTEKAKMESDLEGLAKSRENKMRQEIEQAQ